jgi:hypothetical protein
LLAPFVARNLKKSASCSLALPDLNPILNANGLRETISRSGNAQERRSRRNRLIVRSRDQMAQMDEIIRRLRMAHLEAQLVVCEIERVGLNFEIDSPQKIRERKTEAVVRRDAVLIEWGKIITEWGELHDASIV